MDAGIQFPFHNPFAGVGLESGGPPQGGLLETQELGLGLGFAAAHLTSTIDGRYSSVSGGAGPLFSRPRAGLEEVLRLSSFPESTSRDPSALPPKTSVFEATPNTIINPTHPGDISDASGMLAERISGEAAGKTKYIHIKICVYICLYIYILKRV